MRDFTMKISSSAFADQETIPVKYTCDGDDVIPPLRFDGVPREAVSLALIVDDPDAPIGTWDHWVVWNIPATTAGVKEGETPEGIVGKNSWGKKAWGGPCPPDREHRYFFKLYALDRELGDLRQPNKAQLEKAMQGHVLAQTELIGTYEKQAK
jgi:Raf kinase inhibitor-like YbhB/YbcL family protein